MNAEDIRQQARESIATGRVVSLAPGVHTVSNGFEPPAALARLHAQTPRVRPMRRASKKPAG